MMQVCLNQIYEPFKFGDLVTIPFPLGATEANIVPASSAIRTMLILRAPTTNASNVTVSFGQALGVNSPLELTPGMQIIFDNAVPQNDIYANGSGQTLIVSFILKPKRAENV